MLEGVSVGDRSCFEMSDAASKRHFVVMVGDSRGSDDDSLEYA